MGIFNKLFKKKEESVPQAIEKPVVVHTGKTRTCNSCNMSIFGEQKYTKQMGLYFHRGCWKKERASVNI